MNIEFVRDKRTREFGTLHVGDVFKYNRIWYLRVADVYTETRTVDYYNAVSLDTYEHFCFDNHDEVFVDENATLTVND